MRRMPRFDSEEEETEFWATHDTIDYVDDTRSVHIEIDARLKEEIRARAEKLKRHSPVRRSASDERRPAG